MPFKLLLLIALLGPIMVIAAGYGLNVQKGDAEKRDEKNSRPS